MLPLLALLCVPSLIGIVGIGIVFQSLKKPRQSKAVIELEEPTMKYEAMRATQKSLLEGNKKRKRSQTIAEREARATRLLLRSIKAELDRNESDDLKLLLEQHTAKHAKQQNECENIELSIQRTNEDIRQLNKRLHVAETKLSDAKVACAKRRKVEQARLRNIGMDDENHYNIAICGASGTGKSTFINCLRCLHPMDPGAAPVSAGAECTSQTTRYMLDKHTALWDLPGGFTEAHPAETYCADHCLDLFDCIVMCYTGRWCEINTAIVQYARQHKTTLLIVHTKTKQLVADEMSNRQLDDENEAYLSLQMTVVQDVEDKCRMNGVGNPTSPPVFLIESRNLMPGGNMRQFQEMHVVESLYRCTAARHPDGLSADELWNAAKEKYFPVPADTVRPA
eukprot:m.113125 g.113125  ORF g.113125 m.113125 type:complete len:395 (-) comp17064_c0_seq1:143-1327(-)